MRHEWKVSQMNEIRKRTSNVVSCGRRAAHLIKTVLFVVVRLIHVQHGIAQLGRSLDADK